MKTKKGTVTPLRGDLLWRQAPSGGFLNGQPLHEKELSINNYQLTMKTKKGTGKKKQKRGQARKNIPLV